MAIVKTKNSIVKVKGIRHLTQSTYVIRLERDGLEFEAGQYISLGLPGSTDKREYSIYSGTAEDFIEVLVKEINDGMVSKQLKHLQPGAHAEMDGPFGFFTLDGEARSKKQLVFIASGTGIAPFHSYIMSYPELDYRLIHGVKYGDQAYEQETYQPERYVLCTSRDNRGDFHGRVTEYLQSRPPAKGADYYLCGNSQMIHEVYDILKDLQVDADSIHAEVYF
jgi:ferredoxin--NADP+ reductase/benzoate/toluate 1,2-dioxygenase reductase subunit